MGSGFKIVHTFVSCMVCLRLDSKDLEDFTIWESPNFRESKKNSILEFLDQIYCLL